MGTKLRYSIRGGDLYNLSKISLFLCFMILLIILNILLAFEYELMHCFEALKSFVIIIIPKSFLDHCAEYFILHCKALDSSVITHQQL